MDVGGFFQRAGRRGKSLAEAAPSKARHGAEEAKRTAGALGEVLDERTDGRFGEVVSTGMAKGSDIVGRVASTPGQVKDAFTEEARADVHRPNSYRPEPIEKPEPIAPPEPI